FFFFLCCVELFQKKKKNNKGGREVEVLQAVCGNGYRRKFFNDLNVLANPPKECFTTDDLWISGYLQFSNKQKIPRVLMKERLEPTNTEWKWREKGKWTLSSENSKNMQDIKCINAKMAGIDYYKKKKTNDKIVIIIIMKMFFSLLFSNLRRKKRTHHTITPPQLLRLITFFNSVVSRKKMGEYV
ncbi:hypothetical protein RFI_27636, partial [Reticulomyxa filosa]